MAAFNYTRPGGVWANDTDLLAAEMADLDYKSTHAINGLGGVYALADDLVIGGAPGVAFIVTASVFRAEGDVQLGTSSTDVLDIEATSFINGPAIFNDLVTLNEDVTLNGQGFFYNDVYFNDDTTFGAAAGFYDEAVFNDNVTFHSGIVTVGDSGADAFQINAFTTFSDVVNLAGATFLYGDVTLAGVMRNGGAGRHLQRQLFGTDSDATVLATSFSSYIMRAGVMTSNRSVTIDDTGALDGDRVRFTCLDAAHTLTVKRPGGVSLAFLTAAGDSVRWFDVERIDGVWTAHLGGQNF